MFFRKQKAAANDDQDHQLARDEPTVIAAGSVLEGNLSSDGEVRIAGTVRGVIQAQTCIVEAGGDVTGEVSADTVEIHGRVQGPLRGHHVHLQPGSHVEGDITSATIAIETGAKLSGAVWQDDAPARPQAALPAPGLGGGPSLFAAEPLWSPREDEAYRPLIAARPRGR